MTFHPSESRTSSSATPAATTSRLETCRERDGQWARAKGFDSFCPLGPWIETELDPADLEVTCTVGSEQRQSGRTSQMIYDVAALVAYISAAFTLLPGDVILTGTPLESVRSSTVTT